MAFTATKDLLLPATVTGSWPRPRWYTANMWGRPLDTAMMDPWYREQFSDAHGIIVSDQVRTGLDILTTGDYHLDEDVAGRSWHHYPLQRWKGLEHEELQTERTRSPLLSYPVGTMLDSIYKSWRWPRVVGKVEHDPKNPLEYAKIWRIAQQAAAAAGKPVKFGTCSAQVLAFFLDSHTPHYSLDDKKQLIWDMAEAMNLELRQLAAAGCRVIQVEEPTLHFMARYNPEQKELLDFLVDAFNREVDGLDDVEVWIHTCWGNPNMQKVFSDESYANSMEIYLERLKGDVWTIEATENNFRELSLFDSYKDRLKKKIAVGVVSHRTLQADFPMSWPSGSGVVSSTFPPTSSCSRPTAGSAVGDSIAIWRSTRRSPSRWRGIWCSRNWESIRVTCRPPTSSSRGICCPIKNRSHISSLCVRRYTCDRLPACQAAKARRMPIPPFSLQPAGIT